MSLQYDNYLEQHKANVSKALAWLTENMPDLIKPEYHLEWQIGMSHDQSKSDPEEYAAYDAYFYGGNRSYACVQNFNRAWLRHIHQNPHHWQHWVLINDDPGEGEKYIEIPVNYVIEMICDWWSFSWSKGKLDEIFKWYDEHSKYIRLHDSTRKLVENILARIKSIISPEETSNA